MLFRSLQHEKLIAFIERNYGSDERGRWFFQNGPQRVYVELEVTPWIYRVGDSGQVTTHSGTAVNVQSALLGEHGWLYLHTDSGIGLVHTQDVARAVERLEHGEWPLEEVRRGDLPQRYGYIKSPQVNL